MLKKALSALGKAAIDTNPLPPIGTKVFVEGEGSGIVTGHSVNLFGVPLVDVKITKGLTGNGSYYVHEVEVLK